MNTVWVLVAIVSNGHFGNYVVPTIEFSSEQKCKAAIVEFVKDTDGKIGSASQMRCVKIEK